MRFYCISAILWMWGVVAFGQSAQRLEGEWRGAMLGEFGEEIFILKLKKEKGIISGTLYDSNYTDQSFSFAEVEAKVLDKNKFLVEGKKIIASRSTHTRFNNVSMMYFDFQHPDTIVAKVVEEGNYAALLNKSPSGKEFKMGRMPVKSPRKKTSPTQSPSPPSSYTPIETLIIQDSDREDGDVVRVVLNGKEIVDILVVSAFPHLFPIALNKGKNVVEVTSLSEGSISPTTIKMAILIDNYTQENETMVMKKGETLRYEFLYK